MDNLVGRTINRYYIVEKLGEGGMATVYKAYDNRLERYVAFKVIRSTDRKADEYQKRFDREAKTLAHLSHPFIVPILDYGEFEGMSYFVMVYMPGGSLKQKMSGKPMPYQEAARLLLPVAQALDYAHQHKVIHRDIKPANILFGEAGQPMLSDFGIAKILDTGESAALTGTGVGIGTPEYMAPEQGLGQPVDPRADIYSLGLVFYELVTGRKPFQADTPVATLLKQVSEPLPRPTQFNPAIPPSVEQILFKALAKKPEERYQTAGEFARSLEGLVPGYKPPVPSQPTETMIRPPLQATALDTRADISQTVPDQSGIPQQAGAPSPAWQPQGKPTTAQPFPPVQPFPGAEYPLPRKKTPATWVWILIVVFICLGLSVIGAIGVSAMAVGNGGANPIAALFISNSPTIALTRTRFPTLTPSLPPTETPSPTPAPTMPGGSTIIYQADFSDPNSGWQVKTWDTGSLSYSEGKYHASVTQKGWLTYATPGKNFSDAVISVGAYPISTNQDGSYGIYCRRTDADNSYMFEFSQKGQYRILKRQNGEYTYLTDFQYSADVPTPPDGGTITAACIGSELSIGVNGVLLAQISDTTFTSGDVGIFIGTWGDAIEMAFDNFIVKAP